MMRVWAISVALILTVLAGLGGLRAGEPETSAIAPMDRQRVLQNVDHWLYLIDHELDEATVERIARSDHDLVVIDFHPSVRGSENFPVKAVVERLKSRAGRNAGRKPARLVIAYINIAQAEEWRTYWQPHWRIGQPGWILGQDPEGWSGDYPVAYWQQAWQRVLLKPGGYLDGIIEAGFDGIYMDWVSGYGDPSIAARAAADGVDAKEEMTGWVRRIAAHARARVPDFLVIPQNAVELLDDPGYLTVIDAVGQEHIWFDGGINNSPPGDCPLPRTPEEAGSRSYFERLSPACQAAYRAAPHGSLHYASESWLLPRLKRAQRAGKVILTIDYAIEPSYVAQAVRLARSHRFVPFVSHRQLDRYQPPRDSVLSSCDSPSATSASLC